MWTSTYVPRGRRLVVLGALAVLCALLCAAFFAAGPRRVHKDRHCRRHKPTPPPSSAILELSGTKGACVRVDGQTMGPIPLSVEFVVSSPRRIFVEACKDGLQDQLIDLVVAPGQVTYGDIYLPPPHSLGSPGRLPAGSVPSTSRCGCQN